MEELRETMSYKVSFEDETRRFSGAFSSLSELMTKATSFFKFDELQLSSLRVQYMDDESDLICMSTDEEFREMMRISGVPHIFLSLPAKRKREEDETSAVDPKGSDPCFHRWKTLRLLKTGADREKLWQEIALWKRQKQEKKVLKMKAKLERKQKKIAEREERIRARKSEKEKRVQFRRDEKNLIPSIDSLSIASPPPAAVSDSAPVPEPVSSTVVPLSDAQMEGGGSGNANVPANVEDETPLQHSKAKRGKRVHPLLIEDWNDGTRHLYLDGNNMLFVVPAIRSMMLRGGGKRNAETRLAAVAQHFAAAAAAASKGLEGTVLVFDSTHVEYAQDLLSVRSASPAFATSDDALVQWSAAHDDPKELLVVTSDKGLQDRLFEKGVPVMKPGRWFKMVESILGMELFQTLVSSNNP